MTLFWPIWCVYSIPELICVICIVFSGLGFLYCYTWVIFWFGFIRYHSKYFYILLYVCMLTTMNHCKHWHKSTSYITFFKFITKWCKMAPKKVKRRIFFCRFWKKFSKFDYTSKNSSPHVNRFLVLSQVFSAGFSIVFMDLDTFWADCH